MLEVFLSESTVTSVPRPEPALPRSAEPQGLAKGTPISVLVVDGQTLFRLGLARLLGEDDRIFVAGMSEGTEDLPSLCAAMAIDVVLTDLQVKAWDGIDLTRRISTTSPGTRVIVLAAKADWRVIPALTAGAAGFLLKDAEPEAIRSAVVSTYLGERVLCPEAAHWLLNDRPDTHLTRREGHVLSLVAQGATNREIAQLLHLGDKTVRNYVSRLYRKLEVQNRTQIGSLGSHSSSLNADDRPINWPLPSGAPRTDGAR